MNVCRGKGLNFGLMIGFSTMTMAPAHKALSVKQFLAQKSLTVMEHLPCSPDVALNDIWLFPEIKSALMGKGFRILETYKQSVAMALKAVALQELQKCFQQWQHHWAKCTGMVAVKSFRELHSHAMYLHSC
jgi:hypothetical protein